MTDTKQRTMKRKLSNIDFSAETSHIALVGDAVGGAANGCNYSLVLKSTAHLSDEFIKKASTVKVTMELEDFLSEFFCIYDEDAATLAQMFGYTTEQGEVEAPNTFNTDSFWEWWKEQVPDGTDYYYVTPTDAQYQEYIDSRLAGIEIIKSVHKSLKNTGSVAEVLSNLNETQYLTMLQDQERIEKALANKESVIAAIAKSKAVKTAAVVETKTLKAKIVSKAKQGDVKGHKAEVFNVTKQNTIEAKAVKAEPNKVVKATVSEGNNMTVKKVESVTVEKTDTVEMVEKGQFDLIQKALDEQKVELEKALELVTLFKAERKEAIAKARLASVVDAIKDEAQAQVVFKAVGELEEGDFVALVGVIKALADKTTKTDLFVEKGFSGEGTGVPSEEDEDAALTRVLKAKYSKAA